MKCQTIITIKTLYYESIKKHLEILTRVWKGSILRNQQRIIINSKKFKVMKNSNENQNQTQSDIALGIMLVEKGIYNF